MRHNYPVNPVTDDGANWMIEQTDSFIRLKRGMFPVRGVRFDQRKQISWWLADSGGRWPKYDKYNLFINLSFIYKFDT